MLPLCGTRDGALPHMAVEEVIGERLFGNAVNARFHADRREATTGNVLDPESLGWPAICASGIPPTTRQREP